MNKNYIKEPNIANIIKRYKVFREKFHLSNNKSTELIRFYKPEFDKISKQRKIDLCDTVINYLTELRKEFI